MSEQSPTIEAESDDDRRNILSLETIRRWATPHKDDTASDRMRCLMHIEAELKRALSKHS